MSTFTLPDLGEGLTEAEIVAWHVAPGDHVVADQPLVSVETDKAMLEIPSPQSGHVAAVHGAPGDVIAVGAPLVEFASPGAVPDRGTVVGELQSAAAGEEPPRATPAAAPAVRALASRLGVALSHIAGSGPHGTITRDDVQRAAEAGSGQAADAASGALRGVRRVMARNMSAARDRVTPATLSDSALVHHWPPGESPLPRLVRAVVAACAAEPALNAWYLDEEQQVLRHEQVHLGLAADTADGLFVPVLRNAQGMDEDALVAALERLKHGVGNRSLDAAELRGATISLSNFGSLGGEHAVLVVLPPQVAILGAGRLAERVVAQHGEAQVRRTLPLSLTFDHRVVTGAEAARFISAAIENLERGADA